MGAQLPAACTAVWICFVCPDGVSVGNRTAQPIVLVFGCAGQGGGVNVGWGVGVSVGSGVGVAGSAVGGCAVLVGVGCSSAADGSVNAC